MLTTLSRRAAASLVLALLTTAAAASGGPAHAAADSSPQLTVAGLSTLDQSRIAQQRPLVAAATKIRWELERNAYPGYAGIVLEDTRVALWWKGAVPPAMKRVVADASQDAPVQVRAAAYSMAELRAAAVRLRAGQPVDSIKFKADGSGLVAGASRALPKAATDVGVPVTIVQEKALQPVSRDDDWAPWKGGATIVNASIGAACTAGFGVRNGSASYILTAAHCGQTGNRIQDARGEFIGNVGPRHQDHDIALIPTGSVDGYVYVGTPTDSVAASVEGWGWTFVGEYLCQSGVSSSRELGRPVCNLKVLFYYADREDLVEAEQTEGQTAARPGDSGGPIYSVAASGKLVAKGTTTRVAGARIGFQDYGTAWRDFGITPATR
ncbi:trypsin-like serine protease [Actinoplanes friuliensis]|uniref:trypsin-like serine protease n=1 Tax=Actinoplanes friuliensis TaxID=196914 RepID=UPI000418609D|nr:trypsin-like serine protease [Actinoplanes friuliensis]